MESQAAQDDKVAEKEPERRPQAVLALSMLSDEGVLLFHNETREAFARIPVDGHLETWRCDGIDFRDWLSGVFWRREGKPLGPEALNATLSVIRYKAKFGGPEYRLFNRVAWHEGAIWYDLADPTWRVVRISASGWTVTDAPPLLFRRYNHQQPQVEPSGAAGDIEEIFEFINVRGKSQKLLLLAYIVTCLLPGIAHPVLVLHGAQGAAKTTTLRMLRRLIDPSATEVLTLTEDRRELPQILSHHWMPYFDNIRRFTMPVSNVLCRAVTGDGICKRKLFSDDDDVIYHYRRCVGLSGINIAAYQPDLLDRCIVVRLERIPETDYKTEEALWTEFEEARPRIFSAILTTLQRAIAVRPDVQLKRLPRMSDFSLWGCAILKTLGFSEDDFLTASDENTNLRNEHVIEDSAVAKALVSFMEGKTLWEGSASELLEALEDEAGALRIRTNSKSWPGSASVLSKRLNEVETTLAAIGIRVVGGRKTRAGRRVQITRDGSGGRECDGVDDTDTVPSRLPSTVTSCETRDYGDVDGVDGTSSIEGGEIKEGTSEGTPTEFGNLPSTPSTPLDSQLTSSTTTALVPMGCDGTDDGNTPGAVTPSPLFSDEVQRIFSRPKLPLEVEDWPQEYRDDYEERVAILEYDAGLTREHAEVKAEHMIRDKFEKEAAKERDSVCGAS